MTERFEHCPRGELHFFPPNNQPLWHRSSAILCPSFVESHLRSSAAVQRDTKSVDVLASSQRSLAISRGQNPDVDTANTTRWFQSLWTRRATSQWQFHPTLWWVLYTSMSIPMLRMAVQFPRINWMSVKDLLDIPSYSKMFQSPNESRMMVNDPKWVAFSSSNAWHPKRCDSGISGRFL